MRRAARAAVAAGAAPVVVVLGAHAAAIAPALDALPGVAVVVHPRWSAGLGASLAAGLDAVEGLGTSDAPAAPPDGVLLTVCDQPRADAAALGRLLAAFAGPGAAAAAEYAGTLGVPAVVGRDHLAALRGLAGDAGAGRWLRANARVVRRVPMPEAEFDVDTEADLAALGVRGSDRRAGA